MILYLICSSFACVAPQFTITPKMVTVNESDGEVELCVTSVSPLSREIVVTAQTLPKMDATAPALGKLLLRSKLVLVLSLWSNTVMLVII